MTPISPAEAAKRLGLTDGRVYQLLRAGKLPFVEKWGRHYLIDPAIVAAYKPRPVGGQRKA